MIDKIEYLNKKGNDWYNANNIHIFDINVFMASNPQFVQISAYVVINLNYVKEYVYDSTTGFMIVSDAKFIIARRYLPQTRTKHRAFLKEKYGNTQVDLNEKSMYLERADINEINSILGNSDNIKFIERKGSISIVHFKNGTKRSFYESLKYFESILCKKSSLIRIGRNYIVNTNHLNDSITINQNKTAVLKINEQEFSVSRRRLPSFKRLHKTV